MPLSIHPVERTVCLVKPDAFQNIDEIRCRYEQKGLKIVAADVVRLNIEDAKAFYETYKNTIIYDRVVNFIASGPIYVMILEGNRAVSRVLEMMETTDSFMTDRNIIRAMCHPGTYQNPIHGSNSLENAQKEIAFFSKINRVFQASLKNE